MVSKLLVTTLGLNGPSEYFSELLVTTLGIYWPSEYFSKLLVSEFKHTVRS